MTEKILAKVNGVEITEQDRQFFLSTLGPERAKQFYSEEGMEQVLQELINQELLYGQAIENELDKTEAYLHELEKLKNQLLKSMALRQVLETVQVSEEDFKAHYEANAARFQKPEQMKASHILVKTEEEGQAVLSRLESGEAFETVAQDVSECPSKERGGDLGFFGKGMMVPEFEQAADALEVGAVSGLVKTQFGFHVIKLVDRQDAQTTPLEEVRQQVEQEVYGMKQGQVYQEKINELRSQADIEIIG